MAQTIEEQSTRQIHTIPRAVLTSRRQSVCLPATRPGSPHFNREGIVFFFLFPRP